MLKMSEKFKQSANLVVSNSITLQDEVTDAELGKGRKFVSRFIEAGLVHYKEFGDVLITKETLDKFINTMIGCPVIINHKDITDKNVEDERVGVISNVWYNDKDGWYYCEGIIWDKDAIELVKNKGWNVSCSYDFKSDFESKTHNGKKIDMEFTDGNFLHLALVEVPRYERANIVINSVDNWVEPKNIDYWFSTRTGVKIPVAKGQTKEDALKTFVTEKTTQRIKRDKKKNEAIDILYHVVGKDLNYTKTDLKRNIKRESVGQKISEIIEKNHDRLTDLHYSGEYYTTEPFTYGKSQDDNTIEQQNFLNKLFDDVVTGNTKTDFEDRLDDYYDSLYSDIDAKIDGVVSDYLLSGGNISDDVIAGQLADIYGTSKDEILNNGAIWAEFYDKVNDIYEERERQKFVNNSKGKENVIMTALNELENFVRGIVENACKKEEVKNEKVDKRDIIRQIMSIAVKHEDNEDVRTIAKLAEKLAYEKSEVGTADNECKVENEDKRKLIDEIGGILKGKVDDEIIRTVMKKAEELAYEKSEVGTADNKCKNADEEEKEEKFEEEKEIADVENKEEVEEEEIDEEKLAENKCKKAENSADFEDEEISNIDKARNIAYNCNMEIKSSYITRAERLELGNNY